MSYDVLEGVNVVELSMYAFAPSSAAVLADWGADVIHIEPTEGDPYRGLASQGIGTDRGGVNMSLALANRGKRSVALNIQTDAGMAILHACMQERSCQFVAFDQYASRSLQSRSRR